MTAQIPDTLTIGGENYALYPDPAPLDPSSAANVTFVSPATCCYRGYIARWAIKGKELLLTDLIARIAGPEPAGKSDAQLAASTAESAPSRSPFYFGNDNPHLSWIQWEWFVSACYYGRNQGFETRDVGFREFHPDGAPVPARWVTGPLYVPSGRTLGQELIAAFRFIPSHFRVFHVDRGRVHSEETITNDREVVFPPRSEEGEEDAV